MISKTALHTLKAAVLLAEDPDQRFHGAAEIARAINAPANTWESRCKPFGGKAF